MSNNPFSPNSFSELDALKLKEFEAERLKQEEAEQNDRNWAELHGARQNGETGEWEV